MKKLKPLWVDEDTHACIKANASIQKKKINQYLKDISETTKDEFKPIQKTKKSKWRYL